MKRNVKNEKVLRAITIGLATMIAATSTPITVLADDTNDTEKTSEKKSDETVHIPDEVQNATSDISEAAVGEPAENENKDDSVAVAIDAAQSQADTITTVTDESGDPAPAQNLPTVVVNGETVDANNVAADLNAAEAILNPEMKKDPEGNTLGVTGEIGAIQAGINSSYTEDAKLKMLLPSVTVDENGNTVFTDADDEDITWQIGGTEVTDPEGNTGTQYTVSKTEKTGSETTTTNVNLNTSFDGTEGNGDGSYQTGQNIKSALENAGKAENADNKEDAESFKASAEAAIGDAETQFNIDSANLDEAVEAVNEAQSRYEALEEQAQKAEKAFNDLQELLKEA
ncbi:MAG: hypothetical protein J5367_06135, partial [Lachnospiraceae bacterium]|nr:hypothetical protein [Lachnospiraceae bacterium]